MRVQIDNNRVHVHDYVENVNDSDEIIRNVKGLLNSINNGIDLVFEDAFVIPSSLIGSLLELRNSGDNRVVIHAKNHKLVTLFERLNLLDLLSVKKA